MASPETAPPPLRKPTADDESLLRQADVASLAPASFRARVRLTALERSEPAEIEIWRSGENRTLVRFLDPKERGKYLLYRDGIVYFLSPGARKPVKLPPSFRLRGGATLDDILGLRYARDFIINGVAEAEGKENLSFDLVARKPGALYPRVRYVVSRLTARPVRAEYRLKSGKIATLVEFALWDAGPPLRARKLLLKDLLRSGAGTEVEITELEACSVPEGLFDRENGNERRALETETQTPR